MQPPKAVRQNEMPFGRDTCVVSSNIVLDRRPGPPHEVEISGLGPQFTSVPPVAELLSPLLLLLLLTSFSACWFGP